MVLGPLNFRGPNLYLHFTSVAEQSLRQGPTLHPSNFRRIECVPNEVVLGGFIRIRINRVLTGIVWLALVRPRYARMSSPRMKPQENVVVFLRAPGLPTVRESDRELDQPS